MVGRLLPLMVALGGAAAPPSQPTEVTVYNGGFAFVKEVRTLDLRSGKQTVNVSDVASTIEPTSVGIRSLTDPGSISVLEQNYEYDLISPEAILAKSVGKRIRFIRTLGSEKDVLSGVLLSAPTSVVNTGGGMGGGEMAYNGMVVRTDDGHIVLNPVGEVEVETVPEGLISEPTLSWMLDASRAGPNQVELSYLADQMNWHADYVLTLDGEKSADLLGWVTIQNQSGKTYKDARLKLLAGDVFRARPNGIYEQGMVMNDAAAGAKKADQFQQQSLFEYHLYTLQRPATIKNNETKQLSLLEKHGVHFERKLVVDSMADYWGYSPREGLVGVGDIKPQVRVEFVNSEANHLGIPLPKGTVKVYQRDASGSMQMLGEASIDHTPKDETVSLPIGRSFDVRATRTRTAFDRLAFDLDGESFKVEVRNRGEKAETVYVLERHWGDWRVTQSSMDWKKLDANTMQYVLKLKAGEVQTVTYRVETRY